MMKVQEVPVFVSLKKIHFLYLVGVRNVNIDVFCHGKCLCPNKKRVEICISGW